MDESEAKLLTRLQSRFPIESRPFRRLGCEFGLSERAVLERVCRLKSQGLVRRIGATFHPGPLGYVSTLVGMQVPAARVEQLAAWITGFPEVTHNYEREADWNLWFTVTASSAQRLADLIEAVRNEAPGCQLMSLPAKKRYKLRVEFDLTRKNFGSLADQQTFGIPGGNAGPDGLREAGGVTLDPEDKRLIARLCGDLPVEARPFLSLAEELNMTEAEVLTRTRRLDREGLIRRFGAIVRHHKAGLVANTMVAWVVPEERADEIGEYAASFQEVSHCYLREPAPGWPYTFFTMIHATNRGRCREVAAAIAKRFGLTTSLTLPTTREFKKSSMEYFGRQHRGDIR